MPTKIRLQRFGKKGQAFYRIVIADNRAPRDGRFIENIGTYNPLTIPATININAERALYWLQVGAQPTETARAILSYKGIIYKNHLLKGVKKGAMTEEQAEEKFNAWMAEKEQKIAQRITDKKLAEKNKNKAIIEAETKINEERAKSIAEKRAKIEAEKVSSSKEEETPEMTNEQAVETEQVEQVEQVEQTEQVVQAEKVEETEPTEEAQTESTEVVNEETTEKEEEEKKSE